MNAEESLLREVVRRVLSVSAPEKIILFGSAAAGQMTQDSDIDILIVSKDPQSRHDQTVAISKAMAGVPFPVDVKVISEQRFEQTKNTIGGIAWPAHNHGRVLYPAA